MMTTDDNEESFETRMKNFSESIEHEMVARTAVIEKNAHAICVNIAMVDEIEEQFKAEIKPIFNTNVFSVKQGSGKETQTTSK